MKVHCQLWSTMKCIFPEKPLDHWKSRMDQWKVIASCFFWYLLLYKDPCQRYRSWSCNTSRMLFPHTHTHTHTSELIVRIDFFKNQRRRGDVTVLYHACVCVWYEDVSKPAVCTIHPNCCSISAGLRWSSSGLVLGQKQQQTNVSHTGSHRPEVYLSGQRNRYTGNPGRLWPYVKSC